MADVTASEAIELFKQVDGEFKPAGVFYCSECRAVFGNEAQAQTCHGERICECGAKVEQRYYMKCRECQDVEWREKERVIRSRLCSGLNNLAQPLLRRRNSERMA